jgi:hypothetical protein
LPVRGHQAERIPPLLVPGVANSVFLQHQRADAALLQRMGYREPCLPSPNHNHMALLNLGGSIHRRLTKITIHNRWPVALDL